ncbi:DNA polymerase III subunit beta [Salinactinospora qingdaonensis]|uniref:DNA polymerase III subunit beta n=1 Tax=Salinactinospora qingdaonensis TaxID=702744 RepID=A0ABP7FNS6_9ACTN
MSVTTESVSRSAHTHNETQRPVFHTTYARLTDALATVGLAICSNTAVPIMAGVLLESSNGDLVLNGFDYETAISVRIPEAATTQGRLLVDHTELTKLMNALVKGTRKREAERLPVTISATDTTSATVELADSTMPLTTLPLDDYPTLPATPPTTARVDREVFTTELKRVLPAVGQDATLPPLEGVKFDLSPSQLTLAATDRYRIAVAHLPVTSTLPAQDSGVLVHGGLLVKLAKKFTGDHVGFGWQHDEEPYPTMVALTCGEITVRTRSIDGDFPDYVRLLTSETPVAIVADRAELLTQTRRAQAVLSAKRDASKTVTLTVDPESVTVAPRLSEQPEQVSTPRLAANVVGISQATQFGVNPQYLCEALDSFTGQTVTLHAQTPTTPMLLTDAPDGLGDPTAFRHLIMPIRLD